MSAEFLVCRECGGDTWSDYDRIRTKGHRVLYGRVTRCDQCGYVLGQFVRQNARPERIQPSTPSAASE